MAIYSLNHRPIGKTTQSRPYTASSHIGYITRDGAKPQIDGARMPLDQAGAQEFFQRAEDSSRKNARVGDKLMLALPRELTPEQRVQLVRGYAEEVTDGRAPWFAAFHDNGKDAHNPHCHLIFRDRCPDTNRRVFGTSEPGSTDRLRGLWERHTNAALDGAGRPERVDRRSLEAQGIDRKAPVHEGPRSQAARRRGHRPRSRPVNSRNGKGARSRSRRVDYPSIDRGRTRGEYNRALAAGAEREKDYWDAIDADRHGREMDALRSIHRPPMTTDERFEQPMPEAGKGSGAQDATLLPAADRRQPAKSSLPARKADEDPTMPRKKAEKPNKRVPRPGAGFNRPQPDDPPHPPIEHYMIPPDPLAGNPKVTRLKPNLPWAVNSPSKDGSGEPERKPKPFSTPPTPIRPDVQKPAAFTPAPQDASQPAAKKPAAFSPQPTSSQNSIPAERPRGFEPERKGGGSPEMPKRPRSKGKPDDRDRDREER